MLIMRFVSFIYTGHGDNKHPVCEYKEAKRYSDERMRVP